MQRGAKPTDWARSPAAGFAAALLGLASTAGIIWSFAHTQPAAIKAEPIGSSHPGESVPVIVHLVDLNTASVAELELLPGIGPVTAASIIRDREENGAYGAIEDLDRVSGIGPKTIAGIRERATIGGD